MLNCWRACDDFKRTSRLFYTPSTEGRGVPAIQHPQEAGLRHHQDLNVGDRFVAITPLTIFEIAFKIHPNFETRYS